MIEELRKFGSWAVNHDSSWVFFLYFFSITILSICFFVFWIELAHYFDSFFFLISPLFLILLYLYVLFLKDKDDDGL